MSDRVEFKKFQQHIRERASQNACPYTHPSEYTVTRWEKQTEEARELLAVLEQSPTEWEPGVESKVYTATLDYFATGEGRTLRVLVGSALSLRNFWEQVCEKWSYWFAIGTKVCEGLPEIGTDSAFDFLVTPQARAFMTENPGYGDLDLTLHYNFS